MTKKIFFIDLTVLLVLAMVYYYLIYFIETDIPSHAKFIVGYLDGTMGAQTNFLYYLTVYCVSFFSNKIEYLIAASYIILVAITFLKYKLSKKIIHNEVSKLNESIGIIPSVSAGLLLFCFSLPSIYILFGKYYIMSYPPNVWHNSTTIFAMPFVILLFWNSLKQLENYSTKRDITIFILIVLNILIKPSFIFVYIIAYPILLLKTYGFRKNFFTSLIPIIVAGILILVEYYFIYIKAQSGSGGTSVKIDFMHLLYNSCKQNWFYTAVFFASTIVSSFLFPIIFLYRNKPLLKEKMVQFALICIGISLVISCLFYESGRRELSGNFLWQTFMCSYLLFMVCLIQLLKLISNNVNKYKPYKIEIGLFVLHFVSGIVYFFKIAITSSII
ncbi:hypothetical protein SAMN05660845_2054 [Flavobacterium swingsii]|uniref:EpsG family protein n=1 Tax=Flavobacterium swingsii TaxID=498292 RepID=A0A1I0Z6E2_9FLAO|nr:hypothetical protein [Flavobacterium swingsii]SFB21175.1 hypothetical protein SAMN05660845_2054 [Flavobacterium swingsii]